MRFPEEELTVGKKLILYISRYSQCPHEGVYPPEMTQDGIARKLDISVGSVSVQVNRLVETGCLECRVEHVKGERTRRKVYLVTAKGESIAKDLREAEKAGRPGSEDRLERTEKEIARKPDVADASEPTRDARDESTSTYSFSFWTGK